MTDEVLIIDGCAIVTVDQARTEHEQGYVVVQDGLIAEVGSGPAGADGSWIGARRVDGTGCVLTPGFVNTHHHLYQWATRGQAVDEPLFGWLTHLYPIWAGLDEGVVEQAATGALAWLVRSGCTTTTDHHYVFPVGGGDLLTAEILAAQRVGVRFHPTRGSMDLGQRDGGLPPDDVVEDRDAILVATQDAIDRHHDPSPGSMVRVGVAPCSPFSVTRELMVEAAELARRNQVRLHTHLAETTDEADFCQERFGCSPAEYMTELGWLGPDVWFAHAVHLSDRDIGSFGETGTGVAHCPSSNARLGAGIARTRDLRDAGVPVGLGVDGAASNEASSLIEELRHAVLFARARGGPTALTVRDGLELATMGGARVLGRDDEIGSIEVGKLADLALWRIDTIGHADIEDPVAALVLGAPPPLELLMVGGRPVVEHDHVLTVDEASIAVGAVAARDTLLTRGWEDIVTAPVDTKTVTAAPPRTDGGVGDSPERPDGRLKVKGEFAYGSDLWADGMVWGVTLRSPHPYARILSIDITDALATAGVVAVLTADDVPGRNVVGLEFADQPVLAHDWVRYQGEPVALVAADDLEVARRAAKRIKVDYDVHEPVTDPRFALGHPYVDRVHDEDPEVRELSREAAILHPQGNLVRHLKIRKGDPNPTADVVVALDFEVGMQDQAFLGPESGLAVPAEDGGVDLFVSTQWLHVDQRQICEALGLGPDKVRLTLAGVGGAFGGREDLSMHVHACLLALYTGRPVKISYNREESFFGHVHRHPAWMRYEYGAQRDGRLVYAHATIHLDGGAYASSTPAVVGNAGTMGIGPYVVPNVHVDCYGAYTNNPPCGAMRGFGSVQTAYAYEAVMDRLAAELGMDPIELRCLNAMSEGSDTPTGQVIDSPAPVVQLLRRLQAMPMPPDAPSGATADLRSMPGGVSNTTHGEGVVRGVGYAVAYKNVAFSEGFDDHSTARVRLEMVGGEPVATVHTAAAEVGQGLITIEQQICRTELGVAQVTVAPKDTTVGSGGSTSASRQTYVTGGAVQQACAEIRAELLARVRRSLGRAETEVDDLRLADGCVVSARDGVIAPLADFLTDAPIERTTTYRHRPTQAVDPETGQGFAHVQYAFAAHRAVVDVDTELGLIKVVELCCAQDVGKAINPAAVLGQIHGGSAQGLGLAVMEEIVVQDGKIMNASFTDYLLPTILDMPPMQVEVLELADPHAPYGLRGVGEAPTISSGPAIVAAIRAATGLDLNRVPVRPTHLTGT